MQFGPWQVVISAASALAALLAGFMLEKLFLEEWPWWVFGILAACSALVAVWASYMHSRQIRKELDLTPEAAIRSEEFRLARRKQLFEFLNKNLHWYFWVLVFGAAAIIGALS